MLNHLTGKVQTAAKKRRRRGKRRRREREREKGSRRNTYEIPKDALTFHITEKEFRSL